MALAMHALTNIIQVYLVSSIPALTPLNYPQWKWYDDINKIWISQVKHFFSPYENHLILHLLISNQCMFKSRTKRSNEWNICKKYTYPLFTHYYNWRAYFKWSEAIELTEILFNELIHAMLWPKHAHIMEIRWKEKTIPAFIYISTFFSFFLLFNKPNLKKE